MRFLFFLGNGIGLGHQRRALVMAEALRHRDPKAVCLFITQASNVTMFEGRGFSIVQLPSMHRLPDNGSERVLWSLVDRLVQELDPDLIMEDTYPDPRFLNLPAVRQRPKALLLQNLVPDFLEQFRSDGTLGHYEKILLLANETAFLEACKIPSWWSLGNLSQRVEFIDPIVTQVDTSRIVRSKSGPTVLVTAGAGGDHLNEGFVQRLILTAAQAAKDWSSGPRFVLITGPNYEGDIPEVTDRVEVRRFEPALPELLATSEVVVLRPGYNSMYEALQGTAQVIAVPSISYGEDQTGWVKQLTEEHDILTLGTLEPMPLRHCIQTALERGPRTSRLRRGNEDAARILSDVVRAPKINPPSALVMMTGPDDEALFEAAHRAKAHGLHLHYVPRHRDILSPSKSFERVRWMEDLRTAPHPSELRSQGISAILTPEEQAIPPDVWARHYCPNAHGVLVAAVPAVSLGANLARRTTYRLLTGRRHERAPSIRFDLGGVVPGEIDEIVQHIAGGLVAAGMASVGLDPWLSDVVDRLLRGVGLNQAQGMEHLA